MYGSLAGEFWALWPGFACGGFGAPWKMSQGDVGAIRTHEDGFNTKDGNCLTLGARGASVAHRMHRKDKKVQSQRVKSAESTVAAILSFDDDGEEEEGLGG